MDKPPSPFSKHFEKKEYVLTTKHLLSLFETIAQGESIPASQSIDLVFCGEDTIKRLNSDYRQKDAITDVLSFPFNEQDYLGEIYICVPRAIEQAKEYELTIEEETARLFVHGLFHLLGYDHMTDDERETMEAKEKTYFSVE